MKDSLEPFNVMRHKRWETAPRVEALATYFFPAAMAAGGGAAFLAYAATYIGVTLVASWTINALMPKPSFGAGSSQGLLVNTRDATGVQDVVYGEIRKGGVITYMEATGTNNEYLHMIVTVAGHEINSFEQFFINDDAVTLDSNGFVTDANYSDADGDKKILIKEFTGASNQNVYNVLNTTVTDGPSWAGKQTGDDTNFRGQGIACFYVRMEYDQNVFAQGVPLFTTRIKGKKVYDPRNTTTAYSSNSALCVRDYLISKYGLDSSGDINETTFSTAANVCDENVDLAVTNAGSFIVGETYTIKTIGTTNFIAIGGDIVSDTFVATGVGSGTGTAVLGNSTTENRYETHGVIRLDRSPGDILADLMTSCQGSLFWGQGKWHLKAGDYNASIETFTLDDFRGPITLDTKHSRRNNFNVVRGTFNDASADYVSADYPEIKSATFISDDNNIESAIDLQLPFTTSKTMAQRLAKMTLFRSREQLTLSADFSLRAFDVEVGDVVAITNSRYGFSAKEFEVVGWRFFNDGENATQKINLTLRETSSAAFDWNAEETDFTNNNSTLPDPRANLTISNLSASGGGRIQGDGTFLATTILSWTAPSNAFVSHYEIEWKATADSNFNATTTSQTSIELSPLIDGTQYTLRVRAITTDGRQGPYASLTFTGTGDTTAPSAPTSLAGVGAFRSNLLTWTNPTDSDLKEIQVYSNSSNSNSGSSLIGTTSGTEFTDGGLAASTTKYYFLKAVDFSGNLSGFSSGSGGVTTLADPGPGAAGDTVISGKVFYQILQGSAPGTPTATSYNVSTASFSGLTSNWSLSQPSVSITDTALQEWSSNFTVTIDGTTSAQTIVFTTPAGAIQVTTDIESDNYDGAGFNSSGVRLSPNATEGWHIDRSSGSVEFQNAIIRGSLNATDITAGTLSATRINLSGSQLQDSGGALIVKGGGINTAEIASAAVTDITSASSTSVSVTGSLTTLVTATISAVTLQKFLVVGSISSGTKSQASTYYGLSVQGNGTTFISGVLLGEYFTNFIGSKFITGIVTSLSTGNLVFTLSGQAYSSISTETITVPKLSILRLKDG